MAVLRGQSRSGTGAQRARSRDAVLAGWRDYLVTGGRLHYAWWSHRLLRRPHGALSRLHRLALVAVVAPRRIGTAGAIRACAWRWRSALLGVALSFGTSLPGYRVLHEHVPLLSGLRNVARWGWLPLAGDRGARGIRRGRTREAPGTTRWRMVTVATRAARHARSDPDAGWLSRDSTASRTSTIDSPAESDVVIAEFPFYSGAQRQPERSVRAREHALLQAAAERLQQLPSGDRSKRAAGPRAVSERRGARRIAAACMSPTSPCTRRHSPRRYGRSALDAIDDQPELQLVADEDGIRLYRLK